MFRFPFFAKGQFPEVGKVGIDPSDLTKLLDDPNGVYDFLDAMKNFRTRYVTADRVLTKDVETAVFVNAAGGPVTITLPAWANDYYNSIRIIKIDDTTNPVTIQAQTGDLLPARGESFVSPGGNSRILNTPKESIEVIPNPSLTKLWQILSYDVDLAYWNFSGEHTGGPDLAANDYEIIPFNTTVFDRSSSFNTSTHTYTCAQEGSVHVTCMAGNFSTDTSRLVTLAIFINDALKKELQIPVTGTDYSSELTAPFDVKVGDTISIHMKSDANTSRIRGGASGLISTFAVSWVSNYQLGVE